MSQIFNCYCGREKPYQSCCGLIHQNIILANTAEDLMRSRYAAFVIANGDYLMKSHHSSTRPLQEKNDIVKWAKSVKWQKLQILNTSMGQTTDFEGQVEFKAFFKEKGKLKAIHERSHFERENGYWVYVNAF